MGSVSSASITVGEGDLVQMNRNGGATWSASTPEAISGNVPVTFALTLENGETVELSECFSSWPQSTSASCTANGANVPSSSDSSSDSDVSDGSDGSDDNASNTNCAAEWQQCGGSGVDDTCCEAGTQCFKNSEWYSQCRTDCPA